MSAELKELGDLAKQQIKLENDMVKYQEKFDKAKADLRLLSEETFPEKMQQFEMTRIYPLKILMPSSAPIPA